MRKIVHNPLKRYSQKEKRKLLFKEKKKELLLLLPITGVVTIV